MIKFKKNIIASILMVVLLLSLNGCTNSKPSPGNEPPKQTTDHSTEKETAIMAEFNNLVKKSDVTPGELIKFMDEKLPSLSRPNLSTMIMEIERNQQRLLPNFQDKFADDHITQKTLTKDYQGPLTDNYVNGIQEKSTKDLLMATKSNGFKIETAEGFYFPVIDYSFYKKYSPNLTPDMVAYIDIMAVESDKTPVKDAGLKIGWGDILNRASSQEKFIKQYGNSAQAENVQTLLKTYLIFALYGSNNTPLFSYDDKQMVPTAKKAYFEFPFNENDGSFSKTMTEYLTLLKKNDYKLTKEVDDYRKQAVENFR